MLLGAGIGLGQLTICVLGVLLMTTEYSTGVIRASLLAVPKRLPMLIAKITMFFAAMMVVIAEIVAHSAATSSARCLAATARSRSRSAILA